MANRTSVPLLHGELTSSVIGAFYEVYDELGFGYREVLYALALERVLVSAGHRVGREVGVIVYFRGEPLARHSLGNRSTWSSTANSSSRSKRRNGCTTMQRANFSATCARRTSSWGCFCTSDASQSSIA